MSEYPTGPPQQRTGTQTRSATLWRIWDILQLWRIDDHQWSSDEIELVAEEMLKWTGTKWILPPPSYRNQREYAYDPELIGPYPEDAQEIPVGRTEGWQEFVEGADDYQEPPHT